MISLFWVVCCMIKFVVCEDNEIFNDKYVEIINKVAIKLKIEYEIISFTDYNKELQKIIDSNDIKIYILDIQLPHSYGTDIARKIRIKDIRSFIIFITSYYNKYTADMLENKFMFLKYIDKEKNYTKELNNILIYAINNIKNNNIIILKNDGIQYRIETKNIIYIQFIKIDRKVCIVTLYGSFLFNKSLNEIYDMLNDNFMYSFKSCIVNTEQIKNIDNKNKIIKFKNGIEIDMLSKKYLKELKQLLKK